MSWMCNNLMHEPDEEREKETAPKGACNCFEGCITEVEREGPRGGHEGGKRTTLCARRCTQTEERRETRGCTCTLVRKCVSVAACVIQGKRESGRPHLRTKAQGRVSSVTEASPLSLLLLGSDSPLGFQSPTISIPSLLGVPPSSFISFSSSLVSISFTLRIRPLSTWQSYAVKSA